MLGHTVAPLTMLGHTVAPLTMLGHTVAPLTIVFYLLNVFLFSKMAKGAMKLGVGGLGGAKKAK